MRERLHEKFLLDPNGCQRIIQAANISGEPGKWFLTICRETGLVKEKMSLRARLPDIQGLKQRNARI
jgi:hypothetical protein